MSLAEATPPESPKQQATRSSRQKADAGPGHSDIFERLAADQETDLVGLVAYGLYQRRKRAWMTAFHGRAGRFPSQQERNEFAFSYRDDAISSLRSEAENALAAFGERVVEAQIDALREDALSAQTQAVLSGIDSKIERLKSYRHHVIGHLLGFLILVGIVAFGTVLIQFEPSVEKAYHWMFPSTPKPPG